MLLVAPVASATWYVHGTAEPDTAQDAAGGQMYMVPDTTFNGRQAYFNIWADIGNSGVNPNVGPTGSAIFTTPTIHFNGMLGVWKDCNQDGFVGMADGALWEYRQELLLDRSVCGDTEHIVGDWVWEFHWIGPFDGLADDRYEDADEYYGYFGPQNYINDTEARVWGDWGLPGEFPGRSCTVAPPRGTTGSTGGIIAWSDCFTGRKGQQAINGVDPDGTLGLRMQGEPQRSDSLLNQQLPHLWYDPYHPESTGLYEQDSGDAAFSTWDCSDTSSTQVKDDTPIYDETGELPEDVTVEGFKVADVKDEEGRILTLNEINVNSTAPAPQVHNPTGSYYDGLNQTWDGAADHCGDQGTVGVNGNFPYTNAESQAGGVDADFRPRNEHNTPFRFWGAQASSFNWDALGGCTGTFDGQPFPPFCEDYPTNDVFTHDMPDDFGVQAGRDALGIGWAATKTWSTDPQLVDRDSLQPDGPIYATFYATIGAASIASGVNVPGGTKLYGSEWCTTGGDTNGFDCDPDNWWDPINHPGTSAMPRETGFHISTQCTTGLEQPLPNCRELGVKPGQPYQLRDIDCWDGRIASGVPAYASLVAISGRDACAEP